MPPVSEERFQQTLSEIGVGGSKQCWNWLIGDKSLTEFVEWFCQNVTSANYLSIEEETEYNALLSSGKVLEGEELDKELSNLVPDLSELSEIDDDYFDMLSHEFEDVQKYSKSLNSWIDSLRNEIIDVKEEVNELKKKKDKLQMKFVDSQKQCFGKNSSVESAMHQLMKNLKTQKEHSFQNLHNGLNVRFMAELPIEQYIEESALFSSQLHSHLEELSFASMKQPSNEKTPGYNYSFQLKKLKDGLLSTQLLRYEAEAERKGLEHACETVRGILQNRMLWRFVSNPSMLMDRLVLLKETFQSRKEELGDVVLDSNEVKFQMPTNVWLSNLKNAVKADAQKQCIQIERCDQELLLLEKRALCRKLKILTNVSKAQAAIDVIWMSILGEEVTELLNLSKLAISAEEFLISDQRERFQRMNMMQKLKERREYEIGRTETWPLMYHLLNYFKGFSERQESSFLVYRSNQTVSSTVEDLHSTLKVLVKHADNCESEKIRKEILMKEKAKGIVSTMKTRFKEVAVLRDAVFCKSTGTHVVICPSKVLMFQHHFDPLFNNLKKRLADLKTRYNNEKQRSSTQKNILKKLWITFLVNPEEMMTIMDQINEQ